jgi:hypothetical protein
VPRLAAASVLRGWLRAIEGLENAPPELSNVGWALFEDGIGDMAADVARAQSRAKVPDCVRSQVRTIRNCLFPALP